MSGSDETDGYELELERVVSEIIKHKAKRVCINLPAGLKPHADKVVRRITSETDAQVIVWAGSNFGACDLPLEVERLGVDLLIHFGHSKWRA